MTVVLDATNPNSSRRLWGMTLLERNLRLVERLGATAISIIVSDEGDRSRAGRRRFRGLVQPNIVVARMATWEVVAQVSEAAPGPVLLLEAHAVYDRRLIGLLWQAPAPATGAGENGEALEAAALLVDKESLGATISDSQTPWSAATDSLSFATQVERIDLNRISAHDSNMRKAVAPAVVAVVDKESRRRADRFLRDLAGKGINDIVGEFIHPPLEFALTRLMAPTPVTPNQVSYLNVVLSLVALPLFASGMIWEGIAINLVRGVTDGVDGKLARLTLRESEGGNVLDHGLDTMYLPLLFAAFGYHLAAGDPYSAAALSSYLLQFFYWPNRVFSSWYKTFLGVGESDFRRSDRIVRRFHPKRNIFILMALIAMLFKAPQLALYGITGLTAFMFFFRMARLDREGRRLARAREAQAEQR
jgi:phosphatidylglycerophosphate synthase